MGRVLLIGAWVACLAVACVSPAGNKTGQGTTPNNTYVEIAGSMAVLDVPPGQSPPAMGNWQIALMTAVVTPDAITASSYVLQGNLINTLSPACTYAACPWTVTDVPLDNAVNSGVYAYAASFPISNAVWFPTYTQVLSSADVAAAKTADSNVSTAVSYFISAAGMTALGTATGLSATALETQGVVIGLAGGPQSQATADTNHLLPPVTGVAVTVGNSNIQVFYPNANYSASAGGTNSAGLFVLAGPTSNTQSITTSVNLQVAGNANTWAATSTTVYPGYVVVQAFPAQ